MTHNKRVHFIDPVTKHVVFPDSPNIPDTPSPVFSVTSLPSPPLPSTPSSLGFYYTPLPPVGGHNIIQQVHPAMSYRGRSLLAPFHFDMTVAPSQLEVAAPRIFSKRRFFSKRSKPSAQESPLTGHAASPVYFELSLLDETVTYPHMNSIVLISDMLPWAIPVTVPSDEYVTLGHVWQSLHISLRTPVSTTEWKCLSDSAQRDVANAFYARIDGIRDLSLRKRQVCRGVRRLDFLLGNTQLVGISSVPGEPGVFTLHWGIIP